MAAGALHESTRKNAKVDKSAAPRFKFSSAGELRASLKQHNEEALVEALTALRNQLTIRHGESAISPQDERLLLLQGWLEVGSGARDLIDIWDRATQKQAHLLALVISSLSAVLALLSTHYTYHHFGQPIMRALVSSSTGALLNTYLASPHADLVLSTLKLLNVMSNFAGGGERKNVADLVAWEAKSLPKLLYMRRKGKNEASPDPLARPDIRTLYILLVLSFIDSTSPTSLKNHFLEQHRDVLVSIFKGLAQDPYLVIRKVLEVCWEGIWSEPRIKRTLKIGLFNESTLALIIKLYDRALREDGQADHVPADLVHHFLLAICTRPGFGLCFKDRGWYPRESDDEPSPPADEQAKAKRGKVYNKILSNVLTTLKVNEDLRQQELALKILSACPELVAGYWTAVNLTLEPRLSSKWLANIAYFGTIILLPVPHVSSSSDSSAYPSSPPPLSVILENIVPSVNLRAHFTKGLQSPSPLVQLNSALALAKCLMKFGTVLGVFEDARQALEEDDGEGQWGSRRREVERDVRRRVPEFQVILAFSQRTPAAGTSNAARDAVLADSAQRLLWLYHAFLPSLVAEARFDVGKTLREFSEAADPGMPSGGAAQLSGLRTLRRLHVLRLLKASDQFSLSNKATPTSGSNLLRLLHEYVATDIPAVRTGVAALLQRQLSDTVLFQHDADEIRIWLTNLPTSRREGRGQAPDGSVLTDEGPCVATFLDDCAQRSLKAPYRYIEDTEKLVASSAAQSDALSGPDANVSPLLMAMLEQLGAGLASALMPPSDVLAVVTYLRKLVFDLAVKITDLSLPLAFAQRCASLVADGALLAQSPVVAAAVRREVDIMVVALRQLREPLATTPDPPMSSPVVDQFLGQVEALDIAESEAARRVAAYELIDWFRLIDAPLTLDELDRLKWQLGRRYPPAIKDFFQTFHPSDGLLWQGGGLWAAIKDSRPHVSFPWILVHTADHHLGLPMYRENMAEALQLGRHALSDVMSALHAIAYRFACGNGTAALVDLIAEVVRKAKAVLPTADFSSVQEYLLELDLVHGMCVSHTIPLEVRTALERLLDLLLDSKSQDDRRLVERITSYWMKTLLDQPAVIDIDTRDSVRFWVKFADRKELLSAFDHLADGVRSGRFAMNTMLLKAVLSVLLRDGEASELSHDLYARIGVLLELLATMPKPEDLEEALSIAVTAPLPLGLGGLSHDRDLSTSVNLASLSMTAGHRWCRRSRGVLEDINIRPLVKRAWTEHNLRTVTSLLYQSARARSDLWTWLSSSGADSLDRTSLSVLLHALCDSARIHADGFDNSSALAKLTDRAVTGSLDRSLSSAQRAVRGDGIAMLFRTFPAAQTRVLASLKKEVQTLPLHSLPSEALRLARRLASLASEPGKEFTLFMADRGLQWVVRYYAEGHEQTDDTVACVRELYAVCKLASSIKAHLVEPVIAAVVHHKLADGAALRLLPVLITKTVLKPVVVNRHLQSVLHHPNFSSLVSVPRSGDLTVRETLISLLHSLFLLHPTNTCQPSHVEPLVRVYTGTLSLSDRKVFSIFRLFECERGISIAAALSQWSSSPAASSSSALDAIRNLEPTRVFRTCLAFPKWRRLEDQIQDSLGTSDAGLYDPVFVILLFARVLETEPPATGMAWVELFRTNAVCVLLRSLSSKDPSLRELALCQLSIMWSALQTADMQEQPLVVYILNLLKNLVPRPSGDPPQRLSSYTSLLLAHALRGVFYPSNFIYPITARFLLQRPELDVSDVPILYGMLYSDTDDWKKERGWIIRFLSDGLMDSSDWRVLKRRHTWDLLASLFQSSDTDQALRNGVLEVLANLSCNQQAATSLILKSGLLSWIEAQLLALQPHEGIAWIKILENILVTVDPAKLERSTNGEWQRSICRCLVMLLESTASPDALVLASPVILRLTLLPSPALPGLDGLLARALKLLHNLEKTIELSPDAVTNLRSHRHSQVGRVAPSSAPHGAHGIHAIAEASLPLVYAWGECVVALWRASMALEEKSEVWDVLCARVLVWRAMAGEDECPVGEWVRCEAVRNLGS